MRPIGRNEFAFGKHFKALQGPGELKIGRAYHAGFQQLVTVLWPRCGAPCGSFDQPEVRQKVLRYRSRHIRRRLQKVLTALHHQRDALAVGLPMQTMLNQRRARPQTAGHHQVHGGSANGQRDLGIACIRGVHPERLHVLAGGMDVQNVIGRGHDRTQDAGTIKFGAACRAIELGRRPDTVEVVLELAAFKRAALIK